MTPDYSNEQIAELKAEEARRYEQRVQEQARRELEHSFGNRAQRRKMKALARVKNVKA